MVAIVKRVPLYRGVGIKYRVRIIGYLYLQTDEVCRETLKNPYKQHHRRLQEELLHDGYLWQTGKKQEEVVPGIEPGSREGSI